MIEFNQMIAEVEITSSGKYIKLVLDTPLIEYIVGTLICIEFEPIQNVRGVITKSYASYVKIGEIVAVKFKDGTLRKFEEGEEI